MCVPRLHMEDHCSDQGGELRVDLHMHMFRDSPPNVAVLRCLQQSFITMVMVMMNHLLIN